MKICPHCNRIIPKQETKCPHCGEEYWIQGTKENKTTEKVEEEGCFPLLFVPLFIAILSSLLLILAGFVINLVVHFEKNQIKIIWIGASILSGLGIYLILVYIKRKKEKTEEGKKNFKIKNNVK